MVLVRPDMCFKALAGIPQREFSPGPVALVAPCLEVGPGAVRQEHLPCSFEVGAGLLEAGRGAADAFAGMGAWVEVAAPFPWIGVLRVGAKETSTKSKGHLVEASVRRWIAIIKGIIRSDEEKLIKA